MLSLAIIVIMTTLSGGCQGTRTSPGETDDRGIYDLVRGVGADLASMGFPVDLNQITVSLKTPEEMEAMFDQISDESSHDVQSYTPLGPILDRTAQRKTAAFLDDTGARLAFYDPNSKSIVIKQGSFGRLTRGYLAHELAHAYQDQKWSFDEIWKTYQENPSRELFNVTQYVVEGHAELVRSAYEQKFAGNQMLSAELGAQLGKILESDCLACDVTNAKDNLPYLWGLKFLLHEFRKGGWAEVEKAFTNLPNSTEQIIHPKKFPNDQPTEINLPVFQDGQSDVAQVQSSHLGEVFLLSKLLAMPISVDTAVKTASGWDGDEAQAYKMSNGDIALVWRMAFDRALDAEQMEAALRTSSDASDILRIGRVVDWVVSDNADLKKRLKVFLSKHPLVLKANKLDEQSTLDQEKAMEPDAILFDSPYVPKIVIGPRQ